MKKEKNSRNKGDDLKRVKCNTCDNIMEIAPYAVGGNCWKCVASGRAFMIPELLDQAPSNDVILFSDEYAEKVKAAGGYIIKNGEKVQVKKNKFPTNRLGQTTVLDEIIMRDSSLTNEQIIAEAEKRVPAYKGDWLRLVKLRRYHCSKKKKQGKPNV